MRSRFILFTLSVSFVFSSIMVMAGESDSGEEPKSKADARQHIDIFDGNSGEQLSWKQVVDRAKEADVVFLGEEHDDAVGHKLQATIVEELFPGNNDYALALEMLERNEQKTVDAFLAGNISKEEFANKTDSANWAGQGSWKEFYQPMVDIAKNSGNAVIAANTPRRYAKLARMFGYQKLRALPAEERYLFDIPEKMIGGDYQKRFMALMENMAVEMTSKSDHKMPSAMKKAMSPEAMYRAQQLWDATISGSIAKVIPGKKVVCAIGKFHVDFNGGTLQLFKQKAPDAKTYVISMQAKAASNLNNEDKGRADVVIYTR